MFLFRNLFGNSQVSVMDADFGIITTRNNRKGILVWKVNNSFLNVPVEILLEGTKGGIFSSQRQVLLAAFQEETAIKLEIKTALKEQFKNADLEWVSLEQHFELLGIIAQDKGFLITFRERAGQGYWFTVHFENNKQTGVSIDG